MERPLLLTPVITSRRAAAYCISNPSICGHCHISAIDEVGTSKRIIQYCRGILGSILLLVVKKWHLRDLKYYCRPMKVTHILFLLQLNSEYVDDRVVIEEYFYNKGNVCYPHFLICLEIETMSQCH